MKKSQNLQFYVWLAEWDRKVTSLHTLDLLCKSWGLLPFPRQLRQLLYSCLNLGLTVCVHSWSSWPDNFWVCWLVPTTFYISFRHEVPACNVKADIWVKERGLISTAEGKDVLQTKLSLGNREKLHLRCAHNEPLKNEDFSTMRAMWYLFLFSHFEIFTTSLSNVDSLTSIKSEFMLQHWYLSSKNISQPWNTNPSENYLHIFDTD